jgi:GT2 family glycosyltransferase
VDISKSVSIIIPNYNGVNLLKKYLPSTIEAIKNAGVDYEIIVADDCSIDNSVKFLETEYPEIIIVKNIENKGFSYSCNRGIERARCELILLLNSDVKLAPDYFEHQWKYFWRWDTFGVMGRIVDMDSDQIQDAARMPKFNGLKLKTDYFYYTRDDQNRLFTFYLSGANALIDAAKLKQIGGFYELFSPFYCEDMELCLRAWRLKWNCYYEHNAICRHEVSASTKNYQTANWVKSVYYRNRFYLHALHLNGLKLLAWYCQVTLIDLLPKLLAGQNWIWKSYRDLFRNRKLVRQYKKRIEKLMDENESHVTISEVVAKIRSSVKNKRLVRFKP